ncbi:hypothetical protein [Bacillus sp. SG-1]|uniref:hypothetical protein n=1 Tax=Bacillus sp. SG-1 TaxID=161544 RepID=UPI0001544D9C|nr:hypothetical protein [Bacillus sp. SG-1]EDL63054.1 hypothetical protein BSG1_15343 [Bacillus sp. SG-1]
MGYIAPVPHYQYMQYAEREAIKDYDPFTFMPINRIQPLANKDQQQHDSVESDVKTNRTKSGKSFSKENAVSAEFLADITGKGKYINEYV